MVGYQGAGDGIVAKHLLCNPSEGPHSPEGGCASLAAKMPSTVRNDSLSSITWDIQDPRELFAENISESRAFEMLESRENQHKKRLLVGLYPGPCNIP